MKGAELFGSTLPAVVEGFIGRYLDVKRGGDRWMARLKDSDRVREELLDDRPLVAQPSAQELRMGLSEAPLVQQVAGRRGASEAGAGHSRPVANAYACNMTVVHYMPCTQAGSLVRDMRRHAVQQVAGGAVTSRRPAATHVMHAMHRMPLTDEGSANLLGPLGII